MTSTRSVRSIVALSLALATLLCYSFLSAAWTPAPANPPADNVPPPINVGTSTASVQGDGRGTVAFDRFMAFDEFRSEQYCNLDGTICNDPSSMSGLGYSETFSFSGTHSQFINVPQTAFCSLTASNSGGCDSGASCGVSISEGSWKVDQRQYGDCDFASSCSYSCIGLSTPMEFTYSWTPGDWSYCYVAESCSTAGTQSRSVSCLRSDGSIAPDSMCAGTEPVGSQSCVGSRRGGDC